MCSRDTLFSLGGAISNVSLPNITLTDANKLLVVNSTGTGYITSAGQPVEAGVNQLTSDTANIVLSADTGDITINLADNVNLPSLTVGDLVFPTVLGTNTQVLGVEGGSLAFIDQSGQGGGVTSVAATGPNLSTNQTTGGVVVTMNNDIVVQNLTVGAVAIPPVLGNNEQVLGVSGGVLAFIDQSGQGGAVDSVTVAGPNLSTDQTTGAVTITMSDTLSTTGLTFTTVGSVPAITTGGQLEFVASTPANGIKLNLVKAGNSSVIELDGTNGNITTNPFVINAGTVNNVDTLKSSAVMTQNAYVYTQTANPVNNPSYSLPSILNDDDITANQIIVTETAINHNTASKFTTLDTLFKQAQAIAFAPDVDGLVFSKINTTNLPTQGAFLQASGTDNNSLIWANITQDGTISGVGNITATTSGQTTTINTVDNPTFSGSVNCGSLTSTGTVSCEDFTFATYDMVVPQNPADLGKVLSFTDVSGTPRLGWVAASGQTLLSGTNITIDGTNHINLDPSIAITGLTVSGTSFSAPQVTDAGKFLQYNQSTNVMQWADAAGGSGVQSVSGTLNQIAVTGDAATPTIGFPMTNVYFPQSIVTNTEAALGNVGIGASTLQLNVDGSNNVAVGGACLAANTSGQYNVAVGSNAMDANTVGSLNIAIGKDALGGNVASSNNVVIGGNAAPGLGSTGVGNGGNIIIGTGTAASLTTGENNVIIGTSVDVTASTSNRIVLGNGTNNQLSIPGCGIDYDITSGNALTVANSLRAGSMATPSLSVYDVSNSGTTYTLPTITTGALPTAGDVIAYQANGQCIFVPQSGGGGGNVNEVTAGTNITVTGTQADPVVNVNPNLTAIESISMTGATSVLTTGTTTNFVANSGGGGQLINLMGPGATPSISLNSASGIIKTADYPVSGGISAGNHIQTTDVIVQSLFVSSKQTTGDLYSYKFPEITTAAAIPVNSLLVMGSQPDSNFSQNIAYTQLESLIANVADSDVIADGTVSNQTPLILKTSNTKVANYILAVGSDGVALEWIFNANTSSMTVYQIVNNSGTNTAFNMYMTAYARPDGFRTITIAGASTTGVDNHSPFVVQSQPITAPIELAFNLTSSCLVYLSGNNVATADFSATYCPPAIRLSVPLSAGGGGPLSPYISLGRQPISYSVTGTLTAVDAYCDMFLENGGLLITFTKYPQSGSVYGEFFTIPDAKYVQFGLPGYGDIYPGTFSASFFAI